MSDESRTVGLLGGGVIGGGWAARFLLNGHDVHLYDPDPDAPRKVDEVLANARRALGRLLSAPLPVEGTLSFASTPEEAAEGVFFMQESAPERLAMKQALLAAASRAAGPEVVIASSTSGLLPTDLQRDMEHPERLCVGHPFNPVYLLPLVEVVGGRHTFPGAKARAAAIYESIGMKPLVLSSEIDGFVADRLLEALWRESLWLVNDGIATVEEIDDAIRYGAGLRWSFMGSFLTYRIAGGEAGMRHFMAQFGPALKWPWTKLTDVPELTDDLLDRIVAQSDDQAGGESFRDLERLRDDCLVAVMQGLRSAGYGGGTVLDAYEERLFDRLSAAAPADLDGVPLRLYSRVVPPEWSDFNDHMGEAFYLQASSEAVGLLLRFAGVDGRYTGDFGSFFTAESHIAYLAEARVGDRLSVETFVLGADEKRLHVMNHLRRTDGVVAATVEHLYLHVDRATQKAAPARADVVGRLVSIAARHAAVDPPDQVGRRVQFRRPAE